MHTDQLQNTLELKNWPPLRIVSLVPSQTELLHSLGLEEQVVGTTKFCIHPQDWYKNKVKIGGTKTVNFDKIAALQPDLIIGNKEENTKEQIETLQKHYPVWMSDIKTLDDALEMIVLVGDLVGKSKRAMALADEIAYRFFKLKNQPSFSSETLKTKNVALPSAAYIIWRKPYMAAASGTFIDDMLRLAGFSNVFSAETRYPEIRLEALAAHKPDYILLSSEPYPFKEKHIADLQEACPDSTVKLVDGELFSWYGSRLLKSADYFETLF